MVEARGCLRQNRWMMLAFVHQGFIEDELILLKVRCHQHFLLTSDVFDASGRALDRGYLSRWPTNKVWLTRLFPWESPPHQEFICGRGHFTSLRPGDASSIHKILEWCYDPENSWL